MTTSPGHSPAGPRIVVLALGNEWRGDDAAGPAVAARLVGRLPPDVELRTSAGDLTELLEVLSAAPTVVVVDAVRSGAPPGTLYCHDLADGPLPAALAGISSHGLGLADALALAGHLGRSLPHVVVLGIEAGSFAPGQPIGPEVERGCAAASAKVLEKVLELAAPR